MGGIKNQDDIVRDYRDLIENNSAVDPSSGKLKDTFRCTGDTNIEYHSNGKVKSIKFIKNST